MSKPLTALFAEGTSIITLPHSFENIVLPCDAVGTFKNLLDFILCVRGWQHLHATVCESVLSFYCGYCGWNSGHVGLCVKGFLPTEPSHWPHTMSSLTGPLHGACPTDIWASNFLQWPCIDYTYLCCSGTWLPPFLPASALAIRSLLWAKSYLKFSALEREGVCINISRCHILEFSHWKFVSKTGDYQWLPFSDICSSPHDTAF